MKEWKYEYMLHVWGGFWNEANVKVHGEKYEPYKWFDTKKAMEAELQRLQTIAEKHGTLDSVIAHRIQEGYLTRFQHVIQSLVSVNGKIQIVENNLGYGFFSDKELAEGLDYDSALHYMMKYKWDVCADLPDDVEPLFTTIVLR